VLIGKIHPRLSYFGSNKKIPEFAGYRNKINDAPIINPRVGFNYNIDDAGKYMLKGGSGLFTEECLLYGTRMNIISELNTIILTIDQQEHWI
jgi:hypothetical protein